MSSAHPTTSAPQGITYASAGVDTTAGDRAVELMKVSVAATMTPAVVGGVGGFAGMVDVSELRSYRRPLLATSTDGVGTKVAIAQALDVHDTIGQDLVGMVVDDIAVTGARPLFMTDYIACGHVVPERIADIVRGVAKACAAVRTPLLGGETAEHPGLMEPDEYDVAGAATGVVEADRMLGAERVRPGDVLVALAASGLHSNGYSLVRRVVEHAGWGLERQVPEFERTLGEELLEPTRLYSALCLDLVDAVDPVDSDSDTDADPAALRLHAFSHITGGGLAANLARVLPAGLVADVDRSTWEVPAVFNVVRQLGAVPWDDLERTLNLGVGMVAVVAPEAVETVVRVVQAAGIPAWLLGRVHQGAGYQARGCVVSGTKGVNGGAVDIFGTYRTA
nr:phosphoribosylformylglycinamidine cyclo-ligase [Actinomyces trachealis]